MERHRLQAAHANRGQSVLVLQAAELALHGGAAPVQRAPAARVAGNERVAALGLDPSGLGLALAGRAAVLGCLALEVGPGERPASVLARRSAVLAALDGRGLAKRDDRQDAVLVAGVVDRVYVVAHVERGRLGREA